MSAVRKRLAGALLAAATAMTVAAGPATAQAAATTAADHRKPQSYSHYHPYGPGHGHPRSHAKTLSFRCHVPARGWNNRCLRFTVPARSSVYVYNRRSGHRPVAFRVHRHQIVLREGGRGRVFYNRSNRRITVHLAVRSAHRGHRGHTSGVVYIKHHR